MEGANEWIPVVSDAVKIGLGALIAGIFTIVGTLAAHKLKSSGARAEERRKGLRIAAQEFEPIAITAMARAGALVEYYEKADGNDLYARMEQDLVAEHSTAVCIKELHSLESKMAFLSFSRVAIALADYRQVLLAFEDLDEGIATQNKFSDFAKNLDDQRSKVVSQFAKAYRQA